MYEYSYGANNELREVRIPGLGSITISEYQWNRPKTILYPGGSKREYEYDGLMRLKHLTAKDPGGNILLDSSYDYDSTGNIVSKSTEHGTYSYGYDGASRLISADNPTLEDEAYSYDAVGNRSSASNVDGSITHNANNELTMYGDVEYVYDANGNMTEVQLDGQMMFLYHYNADNRLVKVEGGNSNLIAEYYYDPFGRRLWKDVSGTRTYFFYSDEGLVAEYDAAGTELTSYGYKPDSTWTTDPLFLRQNGQYYFYQNDHLGTPQKLTAQNGAVVWSAAYSAFGEANVAIEMVTNNLRFPGQYFDVETGLHYNFQRYYDPGIGRYVSADPIGFEGENVNWYGYVGNNPLNASDSTGLKVRFAIQNCEITATVNIGVYADKYTQVWLNKDVTRWEEVANKIRRSIDIWNEKGWIFDGCAITFVANVSIDRESTTFWTVDADNKIKIRHKVRSYIHPFDFLGEWDRHDDERVYAHEIGHIMHLPDHYHTVQEKYRRVDVPDKGYEWSIMADRTNSVKFSDITELMTKNSITCPCECRCFPWPKCD